MKECVVPKFSDRILCWCWGGGGKMLAVEGQLVLRHQKFRQYFARKFCKNFGPKDRIFQKFCHNFRNYGQNCNFKMWSKMKILWSKMKIFESIVYVISHLIFLVGREIAQGGGEILLKVWAKVWLNFGS